MKLLLVIPCYHERARLPRFLPDLCQALAENEDVPADILPVDDGSGPAEAEWLKDYSAELRERFPFLREPLICPENSGKGGAVYAGWERAEESVTHLAFVDADGAVPAREVLRLTRLIPRNPDAAIFAVRTGKDGTRVVRTPMRRVVGSVFRIFVRALFRFPLPDTQCGFKIVPAPAWRRALPDLSERRFCFDVDLTWHLLRQGVPVLPAPIDWAEQPGTHIRPAGAWNMFQSLATLRRRLGDWRRETEPN